MRAARTNPGYLLVELIAALTLVAIATAALLPSVVGRSELTLHNELVQRANDLDRKARAAGIADGPIVLRLAASGDASLVLTDSGGAHLAGLNQNDAEMYLLEAIDDKPAAQVVFDRLGRSNSYRLMVRSHGHATTISFDGTSGVASRRTDLAATP